MGRHAGIHPAAAERAALCDLMLEVGPDAATLCEGWDVAALAAHLVVRDTRPDAALGLLIKPLHSYTAGVEAAKRKTTAFADLVEAVRNGPPAWSPIGLPVVKDKVNLTEYFIHHEDVRRAQPGWKPRELDAQLSSELWNFVRRMAPLMVRGVKDTRITFRTPGGGERSVGPKEGKHAVTVTGEPGEIVLYLSGRRSVAQVRLTGSQGGQARLAAASLGM